MEHLAEGEGFRLPPVGFGTFPSKGELARTVPIAFAAGYRLVDTSDNYLNEEWVGEGLSAVRNGGDESVVLVTKFSRPKNTKRLREAFEESERKLGRRIDVYLLHWPFPFLWRQQWRVLEDLYLEGRCGAIGVCNFEVKHLKRLMKNCRVKPMIDQMEIHPLFQQRKTTDFCLANDIKVMSYSPFARNDSELMKSPVLKKIADAHGRTVNQVILRWDVQHGFVPIPASKSEGHIRENIGIFDFELSTSEMRAIDAMEAGKRVRFDPDKRFTFKQKIRFLLTRATLGV